MDENNVIGQAKISVDASKWTGNTQHNWNYIGYDEINYTHTPEGEETLKKFMNISDKPYYVRAHHLLCTGNCHGFYKWGSTNAYIEDEDGKPIYNWKVIDKVFDTYLKYNCKPFVELGFMPKDLADPKFSINGEGWSADHDWNSHDYKEIGWACPPKDYNKWYDLIYNLVLHCISRYGHDEVKTWYFELWNEPDISYWRGTVEEYNKLYDYTEAAIEKAMPDAYVGGPDTTGPGTTGSGGRSNSAEFFDKFLNHCVNGTNYLSGTKGTRIDFITFHSKGGGYKTTTTFLKQIPSIKRLVSQVEMGFQIIDQYPSLKGLEIILSEVDPDGWAAGGAYDNANLNFRNTEYYPSYIVSSFNKLTKLAERYNKDLKLITWAFMFKGERCFEGTRTFVTQGIDKPVLNLFKIYSMLGDKNISFESSMSMDPILYEDDYGTKEGPEISGIATMSGNKSIDVLVYCHHDDWDVKGEYEVEIEIANLPFNKDNMVLTHYRIDENHSNAYSEWFRQGKSDYPNEAQMRAIKSREGLEQYEPNSQVILLDGKLKKTINLPVHGISFLVISEK